MSSKMHMVSCYKMVIVGNRDIKTDLEISGGKRQVAATRKHRKRAEMLSEAPIGIRVRQKEKITQLRGRHRELQGKLDRATNKRFY
jgi:hypothetical protein